MGTRHFNDYARLIGFASGFEARADRSGGGGLPVPAATGPRAGFGGAYEGASRFDRELALWRSPLRSADADILPDKWIADGRARDVMRNDAFVMAGANIHKDSIIGSMYRLNAKPEFTILGMDEEWADKFQEEVEAKFTLWAESDQNWIDASRRNTLTSFLRLSVGIYLYGGEVLASVEWLRDGPRPYNTAIQMIEAERLSNPLGRPDDATLRAGVSLNQYGAPQGYYVRMAHPNDFTNPDAYFHKFVKIRKPWGRLQMLHIVEQQRVAQTRGISELTSALKELRIGKKFRDIVLQNAIVNATYAASIESELPSEAAFQMIGGGNLTESIVNYTGAYMDAVAAYVGSSKNMHIDGVKIPHLFPGSKLQLRPAGQGGPLGTEFEQSLLRYTAAGLGTSYEEISRDFSNANYSAIKAGVALTSRFMNSRKRMVADRLASAIYRLWLEEAINKGDITTVSPALAAKWYEGLNSEAFCACEWIGASRGQIDELKETQAATLRIKYNLSTYEQEHARLGGDYRKVFRQIAREKKEQKDLDIAVVTKEDSQMNAVSGDSRESTTGGDTKEKETE